MTTPAAPAGQPNSEPGGTPASTPAAATPPAATPAVAPATPATPGAGTPPAPAAAPAAVTPPAATAPEKYTLAIPEGGYVDASDLKEFEKIARAENWTNEVAQTRLVAHAEGIKAQSARFLEQTKADSTYGGEKLEQTQTLAVQALDRLRPAGTPHGDAIRSLLNKTGYGNHLEIISLLADLGKLMAEDSGVARAAGGGGAKDPADVLYGGTPKK